MKFCSRILIIVLASFLALAASINPLTIFIVRGQLKERLPGSTVEISGCQFNPLRAISLKGIQVKNNPVYDLQIRSLVIGFNLASIFKVFQGDPAGAIESCEIFIDTFIFNKARMTGGYLKVSRINDNGDVGCAEFKYEKLKIVDVKGKARLIKDFLLFDSLAGQLLGGIFQGESLIKLNSALGYQAKINFTSLDLNTFMKDFAFEEKAEVSGIVSGFLRIEGDNRELRVVEGDLSSSKEGGTLTIKDDKFLRNLARSSGQALDLVVESFKNYRYNTGKTTLSLAGNDLLFGVNLDGNAGKRSLNIIMHDFNSGRIK